LRLKQRVKATAVATLAATVLVQGQSKSPFSYSYAMFNYECRRPQSRTFIYLYSQVFGVCLRETTHRAIALDDISIAEQVAKLKCQDGKLTYGFLTVPPALPGPEGKARLEEEREQSIRNGNQTFPTDIHDTFQISDSVYSGKCK